MISRPAQQAGRSGGSSLIHGRHPLWAGVVVNDRTNDLFCSGAGGGGVESKVLEDSRVEDVGPADGRR